MEDTVIIALYWERNERAIEETREKYGGYCYGIAMNLLHSPEDAEETVSDTWHAAWNAIPPEKPSSLRAWLGRVVRNLSLSRWNREPVESALEEKELAAALDAWLGKLSREDRRLFLRRYWYGTPLQQLAKERGLSPARLAQKMLRLRRSLKTALEKEGISL